MKILDFLLRASDVKGLKFKKDSRYLEDEKLYIGAKVQAEIQALKELGWPIGMGIKTLEGELIIPATVEKFTESHYFLIKMCEKYHFPLEFRFNLNAFIQSFRNISFVFKSEENKIENFEKWYAEKQEKMITDEVLKSFVITRNLVVKQDMLKARSKAFIGVFKDGRIKSETINEVSPFLDTEFLFEKGKEIYTGLTLDRAHSSVGEEIGIKREWVVETVSEREILTVCVEGFKFMYGIISEYFEFYDIKLNDCFAGFCIPDIENITTILESDLDPSPPKNWGWI
jgi:hypothetical protein